MPSLLHSLPLRYGVSAMSDRPLILEQWFSVNPQIVAESLRLALELLAGGHLDEATYILEEAYLRLQIDLSAEQCRRVAKGVENVWQ